MTCQANHGRFERSSAYLELNRVALQPLLGSFFNNPVIAERLDGRYELQQELRDFLLAAPVALRVAALEAGRFQASDQARLMLVAGQTDRLKRSLDADAGALLQRGFNREQRPLLMPNGRPYNRVADVWLDPQGYPHGGWSLGPEKKGKRELLLSLGHIPVLGSPPLKRLGQQPLHLQGQPNELSWLGWLGPGWPRVIRNASQLELEMTSMPKQKQHGWIRLQLDVR